MVTKLALARPVCVVQVVPTADKRSLYKFLGNVHDSFAKLFFNKIVNSCSYSFHKLLQLMAIPLLNKKQYELWESFQCYTYTNTRTDPVQYAHCQSSLPIGLISFPTFPIILADILYFTAVKKEK